MQILSDLCSETLKINDTRIRHFVDFIYTRNDLRNIRKTFHESINFPFENTKKRGIKIFIEPNLNPRNITFTSQNTTDIIWKTTKDASINRKQNRGANFIRDP